MYSFFERLLNPFPPQNPEKPPKDMIGFCRHYSRGAEKYIVLMGLATAVLAGLEVSLYAYVGQTIDWLNGKAPETLFEGEGLEMLLTASLVLLALPATIFIQSMLLHQTLLGNFPMAIRWLTHRYLLGHSVRYYQNEFAGRLVTKVMQTALAVRETIVKLIDVLLYVTIYFLSGLVLAISLDWRLAVPFLVWLGLYIMLLRYYLPKLSSVAEKQADARAIMTGRIVDTYTNIPTVKLFSHNYREADYAREGMQGFLDTVYPQMRFATSLTTAVWAASSLLILSVGAMCLWLWSQHALSTGAIAAACGLALRLIGMSHWIMWEVSALFENIGTVRDGMNTFTEPQEVLDKPKAPELTLSTGDITFDNIHFGYGQNAAIIHGFSLHIRSGEKIGLVGRSGAGKSTLVNLLLRFFDLNSGQIIIDQQNIADVTQNSLRSNIGMVTQDTSLLHRSVKENIAYGRLDASDQEIIAAAKQAAAHDFILQLKDAKGRRGYDAHVGERGVNLSGGQRQRIAIARVLLKNAPILVLDEATSALDSEVENAIQQNLRRLMSGKTVIAIAHRLSTIAELDRLIVIDEGRIIEQGTHTELLKNKEIYAKLWERQSGGFLAKTVD